ncbi:MAG: hypothetical protein O2840_03655 [bacterium]|nr:hypothetical protein [bacterium]
MKLETLFVREAVIRAVREYFFTRQYHEVVAPVLHRSLPLEPNLYSFSTQWQFLDASTPLYLSTSPESTLKKALAAGIGNCFAIGHCFRNQELSGTKHHPEFLMLEWYQEEATYLEVMEETQKLLAFVAAKTGSAFGEWSKLSLIDLFTEHVGASLESLIDDAIFFEVAKAKGYATEHATWSELFDQIFLNEIEPHLPKAPIFLIDFPARISPLCKPKLDQPFLVERFEVYVDGMELGNGNTEHTNAARVRDIFEAEEVYRKQRNLPSHPIDKDFLAALQALDQTKKSYAGIGLGIDRLALFLAGEQSIATLIDEI